MKIDRTDIDSSYADQLKDEIGESLKIIQAFDISLAETFPRSFLEFRGDAYRIDDYQAAVDEAYESVVDSITYADEIRDNYKNR